ncbi:carboxypeptidase-like regulatory domain-containing protein [Paenibacillus sp. FSL L8-0436]|uniref:carboxypeptidase-like regulatory domain-containing protein n=1 Tax=Paenibacillus sp. FSL L8-0436 TaxID=2954686 RepID=UPI0031598377
MKIRLKVKHLVLFVLLPLSLLAIVAVTLPFSRSGTGNPALTASTAKDDRIKLLNTLNGSTGSKRMELIRTKIIEPGNLDTSYSFNVYIGASMTQSSQSENEEIHSPLLPGDRIKFLQEYIMQGPADYSMLNAVKQLLYEYDVIGTMDDEADQALAAAVERISSSSSLAKELTLIRVERALNSGNFTAADDLLKQADSPVQNNDLEMDARTAWLSGRLLFAQGKSREALTLVTTALEQYRVGWKELKKEYGGDELQSIHSGESGNGSSAEAFEQGTTDSDIRLIALRTALQSAVDMGIHTPATLQGTLTKSDGTPVSRAGIFLRAESEVHHSVMRNTEPYQIVTDESGHYQFSGVIPGFYQLQIGVSFAQIDSWAWPVQSDDWLEIKPGDDLTENIVLQPLLELKSPVNSQVVTGSSVKFEWEPVKTAAYYNLSGTVNIEDGSFTTIVRQNIKDNKVSIPAEELYDAGGFSISGGADDWKTIQPSSLLGFADPEGRFSWTIDAFDEQGKLLTRSNGYRLNDDTVGNLPFFYYKSRTLTAADKLVKNKKPEQALQAYRRDYAANPKDAHALKMLTHLLRAKASYAKDKQAEDATIPLLIQLVQLRPDANFTFSLVDHYFDHADWVNYNKYYSMYNELIQEKPSSYEMAIHATALMFQGQLAEARKQFAVALEEDLSHRFIGSYLAAELAAGQPLTSVLELAKRYPEHGYRTSGYRWPLLILKLQSEREKQPEVFDKLLHEKLASYVAGESEALQQWTKEGEPSALKNFMKAVLEVS